MGNNNWIMSKLVNGALSRCQQKMEHRTMEWKQEQCTFSRWKYCDLRQGTEDFHTPSEFMEGVPEGEEKGSDHTIQNNEQETKETVDEINPEGPSRGYSWIPDNCFCQYCGHQGKNHGEIPRTKSIRGHGCNNYWVEDPVCSRWIGGRSCPR